MSIVWSNTKGWHEDGKSEPAKPVRVRPNRKRADIAATIHAAAVRKDAES